MELFFPGIHQPCDTKHLPLCFVSVERLWTRKSDFQVGDWGMDSGAFSRILRHGEHRPIAEYAAQIRRWKVCGNLLFAVTQDYMCEKPMLEKTGLSIAEHQRLTIERYDALVQCDTGVYIMPVLQGFAPEDYVSHIEQYGERLAYGAWVGVGSVCKRQGTPAKILSVLSAIKARRPDLRLHGFGVKITSIQHQPVRDLLYSADSMAWSFAARYEGRNANDWHEAAKYAAVVESLCKVVQQDLVSEVAEEVVPANLEE